MELTLQGSETPYPLMKKVINRSRKKNLETKTNQHFFKINGRKCDFECSIHEVIQLKARFGVGYFPFFGHTSYIMLLLFSENKF